MITAYHWIKGLAIGYLLANGMRLQPPYREAVWWGFAWGKGTRGYRP